MKYENVNLFFIKMKAMNKFTKGLEKAIKTAPARMK